MDDYFHGPEFKALQKATDAKVLQMVKDGEAVANPDGSYTLLTECKADFSNVEQCEPHSVGPCTRYHAPCYPTIVSGAAIAVTFAL